MFTARLFNHFPPSLSTGGRRDRSATVAGQEDHNDLVGQGRRRGRQADQRGVRGHGQIAARGRGHDRSGYLQGEWVGERVDERVGEWMG